MHYLTFQLLLGDEKVVGEASGPGNGLKMKITTEIDSETFKTTILIPNIDLFCEIMKKGVVNARGSRYENSISEQFRGI